MRTKLTIAAGVCLMAAASLPLWVRTAPVAHAAAADTPRYAASGDMLPLTHYREWIYLSSGVDMSYSPKPAGMTMFDNVL